MNNVALWCQTHISAIAKGGDLSSKYIFGVKPILCELCKNVRVGKKWINFGLLLNLNVYSHK